MPTRYGGRRERSREKLASQDIQLRIDNHTRPKKDNFRIMKFVAKFCKFLQNFVNSCRILQIFEKYCHKKNSGACKILKSYALFVVQCNFGLSIFSKRFLSFFFLHFIQIGKHGVTCYAIVYSQPWTNTKKVTVDTCLM